MAKRWYEGSCHCRAVTFAIHSEPIVGAMRCNCSICRRKGLVMSLEYYPPGAFELRTGTQALAIYHFDEKSVNHYFCKHCGVYPFHDGTQSPTVTTIVSTSVASMRSISSDCRSGSSTAKTRGST